MRYIGEIKKIFCEKENWASFSFVYKEQNRLVQIKAAGPISGITEGSEVILTGEIINHPQYGPQIKFTDSEVKPKSTIWIEKFLQSKCIKNINKHAIKDMVDKYGENLFDVLSNSPEKLLEIRYVGEKTLESLIEGWEANKDIAEIYKAVNGGITLNGAKKILDNYGDKAPAKLKKNPYLLTYDVDGFGFKKADAVAMSSGISPDSVARVGAGIVYVLSEISEAKGHSFLSFHELEEQLSDLLLPSSDVFNKTQKGEIFKCETLEDRFEYVEHKLKPDKRAAACKWLQEWNHFCDVSVDAIINEVEAKHMVAEENRLYSIAAYEAEMNCARIISEMLTKTPVAVPEERIQKSFKYVEEKNGYNLDVTQKDAVKNALTHRFSVITGGPGTGKTTVTQAIIKAWPGKRVVLCAPTGKASNRMSEVNKMKTATIHRITMQKDNEDLINIVDFSKELNDETLKPETEDTLIIGDEISMVNLLLARKFLEYSKNATLVLVGDKDQLPPIGIGNFFKNLVESPWIPTVKLNVSHRNQGNIALNASIVNEGGSMKKFKYGTDFNYIPSEGLDEAVEVAADQYMDAIFQYPKNEIICLAPMRTGVNALNTKLQEQMNPDVGSNIIKDGYRLRIYDRVMETKNKYQLKILNATSDSDAGVFNGDCGTILSYNKDEELILVEFDDGRQVLYDMIEAESLVLAYAATIHKSQGSEYKKVIILCGRWATYLLNRMGLYTAITRGKASVTLIGEEQSVQYAIKKNDDTKRNTTLLQKIDFFVNAAV